MTEDRWQMTDYGGQLVRRSLGEDGKIENRIQKTAKSWQKLHPTCSTIVENPLQISPFYAKQSQFQNSRNVCKLLFAKGL